MQRKHDDASREGRGVRRRTGVAARGPLTTLALVGSALAVLAWNPLPVAQDALVRMPGTQHDDGVNLDGPSGCMGCHSGYDAQVEPGFGWRGSMMGQAARDPLFWASVAVAAQDSIWAVGRPNATDLCIRCHSPSGWLAGRSEPTNGGGLAGADFDGVSCDFCHKSYDPFFEDTASGSREGNDWAGYWDETGASGTPSAPAAQVTLSTDRAEAATVRHYNGSPFYGPTRRPVSAAYDDQGGGHLFASTAKQKRASFADANAKHQILYSRYHKSRNLCGTCHDVSNPVLENLPYDGLQPGVGTTVLPSESQAAYAYGHVERTFSEFKLSAYGTGGGAEGEGPFSPTLFTTSRPGNRIGSCQDCHMADTVGVGCDKNSGVLRPTNSVEHPKSGLPLHDMTGGNTWVPRLLASVVPGSPNHDAFNASLLLRGASVLTATYDGSQGEALNAAALLAASDRARTQLERAAAIENLVYNASTGALAFRVRNHTGHKLISGYPEGRRMFLNIRAYVSGSLVREINPYDHTVGTLRGLDPQWAPSSPPLAAGQQHMDALVYEVVQSSSLTGEQHTFHFALATSRYKDNRIPPKGFRILDADERLAEPFWGGVARPDYFTAAEYLGGYDDVAVSLPPAADGVVVALYYQTTSREYIEFLRDEINGTGGTLPGAGVAGDPAYLAQSDPFFGALAAWGDTIWQLWNHNKAVAGAAPVLMTQAHFGTVTDPCASPGSDGTACNDGNACTTGDTCVGGSCSGGTPKVCSPINACHLPGVCNSATGQCSNPLAPDGTACPGGTCVSGTCVIPDAGTPDADPGDTGVPDALADVVPADAPLPDAADDVATNDAAQDAPLPDAADDVTATDAAQDGDVAEAAVDVTTDVVGDTASGDALLDGAPAADAPIVGEAGPVDSGSDAGPTGPAPAGDGADEGGCSCSTPASGERSGGLGLLLLAGLIAARRRRRGIPVGTSGTRY